MQNFACEERTGQACELFSTWPICLGGFIQNTSPDKRCELGKGVEQDWGVCDVFRNYMEEMASEARDMIQRGPGPVPSWLAQS
jgi:hypothetical protein